MYPATRWPSLLASLVLLLLAGCVSLPTQPEDPLAQSARLKPTKLRDAVTAFASGESVFVTVESRDLHETDQDFSLAGWYHVQTLVFDASGHRVGIGDSLAIIYWPHPGQRIVGYTVRRWHGHNRYGFTLARAMVPEVTYPAPFELGWVTYDGSWLRSVYGTCAELRP